MFVKLYLWEFKPHSVQAKWQGPGEVTFGDRPVSQWVAHKVSPRGLLLLTGRLVLLGPESHLGVASGCGHGEGTGGPTCLLPQTARGTAIFLLFYAVSVLSRHLQ